ncbi:tetratricopeptide repeat protein [Candidatus Poriferisocius sp.]|uniref:tetratricopeptide repeat protein n=1 Tax=Candidatus Poriferisocius sp. TaxID=3101276 RepID=UPI003B516534
MDDSRGDEQEFWLASLEDLDEELAAGDLDPEDHQALSRSYTRKAADALRGDRGEPEQPDGRRRGKLVAAVIGLVAVGIVAGIFLGRAVGSRHSGDTITGNDAVTSVPGLLRNAEESAAAGDLGEAIAIYDRVLERSPSNPNALAYKGWLLVLEGQEAEAADVLADAVVAAPGYSDARAFRAIVLYRTGDCSGAAGELGAFDATDPPEFISQLVENQGLRTNIALCQIASLAGEQFETLADLGLAADDAVAAARALWDPKSPSLGDPALALRVYQVVLVDHPRHAGALTFSGVMLAQTGLDDQVAEGARRINQAVEAAPNHPEARLWRAWLSIGLGQTDQARADLDHLDSLNPPDEIARLSADLRSRLS